LRKWAEQGGRLEFKVQVQSSGFSVQDSAFRVQSPGFCVHLRHLWINRDSLPKTFHRWRRLRRLRTLNP